MNPTKLKRALWALALGLIVGALVMWNLAIYYSSISGNEQMGWAIFCALNGIWVAGLGVICIVAAESHEVAMRQLDYDRKFDEETA